MKAVLFAILVAYVAADCKPPTTDFKVADCSKADDTVKVDLSTVKMSPYPANPKVPVAIDFTSDNTGSAAIEQLYVDVGLSYYGSLFFKCGWHSIPIPINNIDGCKVGGNCPIKPGVNPTKVSVDLSPFAAIIEKLASNCPEESFKQSGIAITYLMQTYYRLKITVKAADKTTELNCLQADFLLA